MYNHCSHNSWVGYWSLVGQKSHNKFGQGDLNPRRFSWQCTLTTCLSRTARTNIHEKILTAIRIILFCGTTSGESATDLMSTHMMAACRQASCVWFATMMWSYPYLNVIDNFLSPAIHVIIKKMWMLIIRVFQNGGNSHIFGISAEQHHK